VCSNAETVCWNGGAVWYARMGRRPAHSKQTGNNTLLGGKLQSTDLRELFNILPDTDIASAGPKNDQRDADIAQVFRPSLVLFVAASLYRTGQSRDRE
jgi:hypothetical protein